MCTTEGRAVAVLVADGVEFDARDATLFREIDRTHSVAAASTALGRSRARALSRIEALEGAFGELVERSRGGTGGGGSRLTENARDLLGRFDRLRAALTATAQVPETVLEGTVETVTGELAEVATDVGSVRGRHDGATPGETIQVRVGADAITVLGPGADADPDSTSARNRLTGRISAIDRGETVSTVGIDVGGTTFRALLTEDSAARLGLETGQEAEFTWKATATRLVRESGPDTPR